MHRRKFLGISAAATAAIMSGAFSKFAETGYGHSETIEYNFHRPRMFGGCGDSRLMNDSFPGFLEREIIDFRA